MYFWLVSQPQARSGPCSVYSRNLHFLSFDKVPPLYGDFVAPVVPIFQATAYHQVIVVFAVSVDYRKYAKQVT